MIANLLPDNSQRRKNQRKRKINVIVGNPPYSAGQTSANDNAANLKYANLDRRIEGTYAVNSSATNKNALYDSYIRAFRMASDRIGEEGVIGFVTGAGWIDGNATDGMRKCLVEEFDKIYVFNLRGNARTSGEMRRKESGNVFGHGSRTPIAVTILVRKRGSAPKQGKIFYCDIGDYFDREEKLRIISIYGSIKGISRDKKWDELIPDSRSDWINKGRSDFDQLIPLVGNNGLSKPLFRQHCRGLETGRDAWVYNFSRNKLIESIKKFGATYNSELKRVGNGTEKIEFHELNRDKNLIAWTSSLLASFDKRRPFVFLPEKIVEAEYRPFCRMYVYRDDLLIHRMGKHERIFSNDVENLCLISTGVGAKKDFSVLVSNRTPDLNILEAGAQCYPLWIYDSIKGEADLISSTSLDVSLNLNDLTEFAGLGELRQTHSKDHLFYYIYALFHNSSFTQSFRFDLMKKQARFFLPKRKEVFSYYVDAGKTLVDLHANYYNQPMYPVGIVSHTEELFHGVDTITRYRVQKMRFAGTRGREDKTTVIYNEHITIKKIPLEAYEYVVNGKPALEWVMERQCVKVDKDSGIVNDANDYAIETMNNPAYPLELFQRVITVSLETMKIVKSLPPLDL